MVSIDKNEVEVWLQKIQRCEETRDFEISQELDNLKCFLGRTQEFLAKLGDTATIIQRLPNVGQLLTKIGRKQDVLLQDGMYDVLVRCVLELVPTKPETTLEKRAAQWAQALIRKTTSYFNQQNPCSRVAGLVGYGASDFHEFAIQQLIKSICQKLEALVREKDDQEARNVLTDDAADTFQDISAKVTPLLKIPSCQSIVERLLHYSRFFSCPSLSESFLSALLEIQAEQFNSIGDNQTGHLSESCCLALWSCYLPGLEHAVMCFIQILSRRPHISHSDAMKLLISSHLPKACCDDPSLYMGVDQILRRLLVSTDGSPVILKAIYIFQCCCYQEETVTAAKQNHQTNHLVPSNLTSLKAMLQIYPSVLSSSQLEAHLKTLWIHISNLIEEVPILDLWSLVVKHQHWYHQALLHAFSIEPSVKDSCCSFIAWFQNPTTKDVFKNPINDFIKCLISQEFLPKKDRTQSLTQALEIQLLMAHGATLAKDGKDLTLLSSCLPADKTAVDEVIFLLEVLDLYSNELGMAGRQAVHNLLGKLALEVSLGNDLNVTADIRCRLDFHLQPSDNG